MQQNAALEGTCIEDKEREVGDRHHYVAQFHLRGFTDPSSATTSDPWLWCGDCADGEVRRRAPKNIAWERGLYDVAGGFVEADANLERFLAEQVEGPAAAALRTFVNRPKGSRGTIPAEISRYLAWAAARTPAVRTMLQEFLDGRPRTDGPFAEAAPEWFGKMAARSRVHRMQHSTHGIREDVDPKDVAILIADGWSLLISREDFGEILHVQAAYFGDRFFPRMRWIVLDAPDGAYFVLGDRAVVWCIEGELHEAPAVLRRRDAKVFAPLTHSLALLAVHAESSAPTLVRVEDFNRIVALAANDWIVGPTQPVVTSALAARQHSGGPGAV